MSNTISAIALISAALVILHPTKWAAAGACILNASASVYGWWSMIDG
ncbi:hypothetical protein [Rhizobium grahamii]|nr:hypothetical protein [Rhizobium grahamii]